jgi:drug/metabolite transporter (DMT)-like permease
MERENHIKKKLIYSTILIVIGLLVPVLSLLVDYRPEGEELSTWFQRSGSVLVVFTVWVEINLLSIHSTMYPGAYTIVVEEKHTEKFELPYNFLVIASAVFAVVGTAIWGYGDILIKYT